MLLQIFQGGKVLRYTKLNCNLLENICGWFTCLVMYELCNEGMVELLWRRFVSESIRFEPTISSPATFSGVVTSDVATQGLTGILALPSFSVAPPSRSQLIT